MDCPQKKWLQKLIFRALLVTPLVSPFAYGWAPQKPCGLRNPIPGFHELQKVAQTLPTVAGAVSLKVRKRDQTESDCGAAVISDEGHLLTAAHCIRNCSENSYVRSQDFVSAQDDAVRPQKVPRQCFVIVNEERMIVNVEMASCDKAETKQFDPNGPCEKMGDVAILEPLFPPQKMPGCLPISQKVTLHETVVAIGQPVASQRGQRDSPGQTLVASFGRVIPPQNSCTIIQNADPEDRKRGRMQSGTQVPLVLESYGGSVNRYMQENVLIQTTVDFLSGNSGGPLINERGEIVGVAASVDSHLNNTLKSCMGSTFMAPLIGLKGSSLQAPGFDLNKIVCDKKRIRPSSP